MAPANLQTYIPKTGLRSYAFKVVLEKDRWPDEPDSAAVWFASVPSLEKKGAATWGKTKEEALKNIQDVLQMVIEEMAQQGESFPDAAIVAESKEPIVTVTVAQ